ncbi:hypothetical protein GQ457_01G035960 [Hibiscus cannabinus]
MELRVISGMVKRVRRCFLFFFLAIFSKAIGTKPLLENEKMWENFLPDSYVDSFPSSNDDCRVVFTLFIDYTNPTSPSFPNPSSPSFSSSSAAAACICNTLIMELRVISGMVKRVREMFLFFFLAIFSKAIGTSPSGERVMYVCMYVYRCEPYDPWGFKTYVMRAECPAIPAVLGLFQKLVDTGFKVFLITGRDEETLATATIDNLHTQGFIGYERVIFRTEPFKGKSAVVYKSAIRKQLMEQGYRIWGNVGTRKAERKKIKQEYERKGKQVEIRKKIEYSMQLNASRIKVLQAQEELVTSIKETARKELQRLGNDKRGYKNLVKALVVQSLVRLREPSVLLRCREMDRKLVESIIDEAKREYAEKFNVAPPKIVIDNVSLPPPPPADADDFAHQPYWYQLILISMHSSVCFIVILHSKTSGGTRVHDPHYIYIK